MNEPLSKDDQGEEQQNNYSFDGKPGSYDSNSNSAQRKKSFSTTKPTEYNLPKKQPESTSNNLETKAKNILLPWRKKHNKDSESSGTNTDADMGKNANAGPDVNPIIAPSTHSHSKSISSPNIKTTPPTTYGTTNVNSSPDVKTTSSTHDHAHSHSKTATTPTTTHGHSNVNTGSKATTASHELSHAKTTPPTHAHAHDSTGPKTTAAVTAATAAMQEHSHAKTTPSIHGQAHDSTGPNAATTTTHGYAHIKTTYPATPVTRTSALAQMLLLPPRTDMLTSRLRILPPRGIPTLQPVPLPTKSALTSRIALPPLRSTPMSTLSSNQLQTSAVMLTRT